MKIKKVSIDIEKRILTGMIVSDRALKELDVIYDPNLVQNPYIRTVAGWCRDYLRTYKKAPGETIEDLYHSAVRDGLDPDVEELIGEFLSQVSDEYERAETFNVDYLLDEAERYFKSRSLEHLSEDISAVLSQNDVPGAEELVIGYRSVSLPKGDGINPFGDEELIREAFEESNTPLFRFPGAAGEMLNSQLTRDSLIGIQGPEKRGKTWWLMEFAMRAYRARCNVAFFQVGDLTRNQMVRRLHIRLAGRSDKARYCGTIRVPTMDCHFNQIDDCKEEGRTCDFGIYEKGEEGELIEQPIDELEADGYAPCTICRGVQGNAKFRGAAWHEYIDIEPITWRDAVKRGEYFLKKRIKGREFRLASHPSDTINVRDISSTLDRWEELEGFIPDVVLIDYADILAPEDNRREFRHQVNDTWKAMRRLSMERHICIITATQADVHAHEAKIQTLKHFSEDKRKYAHVTMMLGLNQTVEEKRKGVMRLNHLVVREDEFDTLRTVTLLQSLQRGKPLLDSFWTF